MVRMPSLLASGLALVAAVSVLTAAAGCSTQGGGEVPDASAAPAPAPPDGMASDGAETLDASSSDGPLEASGVSPCVAAGGRCRMYPTYCALSGPAMCGSGAFCCYDPPCKTFRASAYDQSCTVDTDCWPVFEGNACDPCAFACNNAAVSVQGLGEYSYEAASVTVVPAEAGACPSCGAQYVACCRAGTCQLGSQCLANPPAGVAATDTGVDAATDGGPLDAGGQ
jgi:hypothetical protein